MSWVQTMLPKDNKTLGEFWSNVKREVKKIRKGNSPSTE